MAKFESKGPSFARYLQQENMAGAEFCMQIDSHTYLTNSWDSELLKIWASAENEYAVISTQLLGTSILYVLIFITTLVISILPDAKKSKEHASSSVVPHMCNAEWGDRGIPKNSIPRAAANLEKPLLSPMWSAGFSFSKCHAGMYFYASQYFIRM